MFYNGGVEVWKKVSEINISVVFYLLCSREGEGRSPLLAVQLYPHLGMENGHLVTPERPRCGQECSNGVASVVLIAPSRWLRYIRVEKIVARSVGRPSSP